MTSDEAIAAATKVAWDRYGFRPDAAYLRAILKAAAPHMLAGDVEWAVFRKRDGVDADPVEGFRYRSKESAQRAIERDYNQPDYWEPRGRLIGQWTPNPYRSQT